MGDRLILATHNPGKIKEFATLLGPLGVTVVGAAEAGLPEPEETETTFSGNAILKARAATEATGLPALADDSGLSVDALDGAPGIYSARWAGPEKDFAAAMTRVLKGVGAERSAAFIAVLALTRPGEAPLTFEGITRGTLSPEPRGSHGFGYDPIFIPDEGDGRTFGEMAAHEKTALSHRARATQQFLAAARGEG